MVGAAWSLRGPGTAHISHRFSRGARAETGARASAGSGRRWTSTSRSLRQAAAEFDRLPADAPDAARRALYFRARWTIREMALANPLLAFDHAPLRQTRPHHVPAHERPVLRLVVAPRRRRVRARAASSPASRRCAASPATCPSATSWSPTCPSMARRCCSPPAHSIPTSPTSGTRRTSRASPRTPSTTSSR